MSVLLYSQEQIVKHLENASPTKFMYSFARAERFPPLKRSGKSDKFYNLRSVRMNRTAGFGYGTKYDFTKSKNLKTEFGSLKRDFDIGNQRGLKFSFGIGRDAYRKAFCPGYKNDDKNIPGPAKYQVRKELGSDAPKYTMHSICGERSWTNKNINTPAPGTYQPVVKINDKGRYPVSNISNIKVSNFGLSHTNRFNYYKNNNLPGPDSYKYKTLMGTIYNSKYRSGHLITMSPKFKIKDTRENYPGPGQYIRFSEFGILVSKNARKQREQNEEIKSEMKNKIAKTEMNETSEQVQTTKNETKALETQ